MKRLNISDEGCTETLALLITMAWADGKLDDEEKQGVRVAAEVLGVPAPLRERLEKLLQQPLRVDELLFETVSPRERSFAFVAAAWLSGVDGSVDPKEKALLAEVGSKLGLPASRRAELVAIARELPHARKGARRWGQELATLFEAIVPRLHSN
jgi:uncharacterized membrane protein YebE (DUF533 family)